MRLQEIASSGSSVKLPDIGLHNGLAEDLQNRLTVHGLLDPPADGAFGPISHWALREFRHRMGVSTDDPIDATTAKALLRGFEQSPFPYKEGSDLAGRILKALTRNGYWFSRHPECVNIVYVEGLSPDGVPNTNAPDMFNDLRLIIRLLMDGTPAIANKWEATTEPGRFFTQNPLDPKGAARIAFGQYKAWTVGIHRAGEPGGHEALLQTVPITVFRDLDKNFNRQGDLPYTGLFGINQHWGYDQPKDNIGKASAGCLVGRTTEGHKAFMTLVKSDPRYRVNNGYRFMTAVIDRTDLP